MSEESHTVKQAFLMFGDAMRSLNATTQRSNALLEEVVGELRSLHRGHQEIITRMDVAEERRKDIERRVVEGERKSEGKIKLLERRLDSHDEQFALLRSAALKG